LIARQLEALRWLEDWLPEHRDSLGLTLGSHVVMRRTDLYTHEFNAVVVPATDIRPLEKFVVPAALDGSNGTYRRPQAECLLAAQNDYQAIATWISAKQGLTSEQRIALRSRRRDPDLARWVSSNAQGSPNLGNVTERQHPGATR
jgi:hypothetical protein